ncbi:MAG: F0F1 ATP synthase subunit delta [Gammaproteobacteria bacterium]|nr:F0F1 ATP synthase subunit delta [Gammaproteobacteria bacterium]NNC97857.1 F0F1 ATP synthase subunit delta [Gammaproteobacteria bacterium]NNM12927.1 F0F1 ATP synthase subunit delta [Gammaproteobacteria bacterium]
MSEQATVARPYAKAAFDLAQKSAQLGEWSSMLSLAADIANAPDMQKLLAHPQAGATDLVELFNALGKDAFSQDFLKFLKVLNENRRLNTLPAIADQFEAQRREAESRIKVVVTSAAEIADEQVSRMLNALKNRYQKEVELDIQLDPGLVGGAIINAGDEVIDGSVHGRLQKLTTTLMS